MSVLTSALKTIMSEIQAVEIFHTIIEGSEKQYISHVTASIHFKSILSITAIISFVDVEFLLFTSF